MYPRLLDFSVDIKGMNGVGLDSYFAMVAIGFIIGTYLIRRWATAKKIDPGLMTDFVIWMAVFGLLGSKILHVIADGHFWDYVHACTDPSLVDWPIDKAECNRLDGIWNAERSVCNPSKSNCWAWIDITSGGFTFYGGFIGAALFSIYFIRKYNLPGGKIVDMSGWILMMGVAWGRIGCMLAGCCFGARTDSILGVVFPPGSPAARFHHQTGLISTYRMSSLPVHMTQAYESLAALAIAAAAYLLVRPRKRFDGQVFCFAAGAYAVFRFMVEFIRNDERGGLFGITTSQIIAVGFLAAIVYMWKMFSKRSHGLLKNCQKS